MTGDSVSCRIAVFEIVDAGRLLFPLADHHSLSGGSQIAPVALMQATAKERRNCLTTFLSFPIRENCSFGTSRAGMKMNGDIGCTSMNQSISGEINPGCARNTDCCGGRANLPAPLNQECSRDSTLGSITIRHWHKHN
jgi:hypothetical protein